MHAATRHSIRSRKLKEVGVVEIDINVALRVSTLLNVFDCAISRVVMNQRNQRKW